MKIQTDRESRIPAPESGPGSTLPRRPPGSASLWEGEKRRRWDGTVRSDSADRQTDRHRNLAMVMVWLGCGLVQGLHQEPRSVERIIDTTDGQKEGWRGTERAEDEAGWRGRCTHSPSWTRRHPRMACVLVTFVHHLRAASGRGNE